MAPTHHFKNKFYLLLTVTEQVIKDDLRTERSAKNQLAMNRCTVHCNRLMNARYIMHMPLRPFQDVNTGGKRHVCSVEGVTTKVTGTGADSRVVVLRVTGISLYQSTSILPCLIK